MMSGRRSCLLLLLTASSVTLTPPRVEAEVATALLRFTDPLPELPGHQVVQFHDTAVSRTGGFAVGIASTQGFNLMHHIWGNPTGGPGDILRSQSGSGPWIQDEFRSGLGLDDTGRIAYAARCWSIPAGDFSNTVWRDGTAIVVGEEPYPGEPGTWWVGGSRPQITADGQPWFLGLVSDEPGGASDWQGLFHGMGATLLLRTGDVIPGLPDPVASTSNYDCSLLGSNYLAHVWLEASPLDTDEAIVINGAGLEVGGSVLREGGSVPLEVGGLPGEHWERFGSWGEMAITESGDWVLAASTDADSAVDDVILRNGTIVYREGDVVDGEVLEGRSASAIINESGDLAFIWSRHLYLNGRILVREGDPVDWSGDGIVDPEWAFTPAAINSYLSLSERGPSGLVCLYLIGVGNEDPGGPYLDAFFRVIADPEPASAVTPPGPALAGALGEASPNPFVRATSISFALTRDSRVRLTISDVAGRHVATLVEHRLRSGGHTVVWPGRGDTGSPVASGVYFYRLEAEGFSQTRKVVHLR